MDKFEFKEFEKKELKDCWEIIAFTCQSFAAKIISEIIFDGIEENKLPDFELALEKFNLIILENKILNKNQKKYIKVIVNITREHISENI